MRQENFLIALFNKELLDLRVPLQRSWPAEEGKGRTLTRALEWNLQFCLMEYLFDRRGRVRKVFLKSKNRAALIDGCVIGKSHPITGLVVDGDMQTQKTFHLHGNTERHVRAVHRGIPAYVFLLPIFRSTFFLLSSFGNSHCEEQESYKNPSSISGRAYTPFAQWKFREFNELPHLFERRLKESYPIANMYMNQFPNEKLAIVMR